MEASILEGKPWLADRTIPAEIQFPKGMLGHEERVMLYYLARTVYQGQGTIIDAGAFAGSSAFCFASGLSQSPFRASPFARVHSYDVFEAIDQYVADAITANFKPLRLGGRYLDVFEFQTGKYKELITVHPGDFMGYGPPPGPIEILFIDVAKTLDLNRHLVSEFFPRLTPGLSLVIQQDYYHAWHPYMQVTMEILSDYLEVVDSLIANQSRLYRYVAPIPDRLIRELSEYAYSGDFLTETLDRAIAKNTGISRSMLEVTRVWQLMLLKRERQAFEAIAAMKNRSDFDKNELWGRQLLQIEEVLQANGAPVRGETPG